MSSDIIRDDAKAYAEALGGDWQLEDARFANVRKMLKQAGEEFEEAILWRLQDDLHHNLANKVRDCAERAIGAVLGGNDRELRRWLSVDQGSWTGRERLGGGDAHPVINGTLSEAGALELRKRIVDAHADLLKDERVLDLEAQVKSLVEQVNKLTEEKHLLQEKLRMYRE